MSKQTSSTEDLRFDQYMKLLMKLGHIPSMAVCIVKDNEIAFAKAYGYYDIENNKSTKIDTIYQVGSISKPVTATALMQLIENESYGINLDDNVSEWLPFDLKNPNFPEVNITFRMLLAHRSSIIDFNTVCHQILGDPDIPSYLYPFLKDVLLINGSLYHPGIWSDNDRPGDTFYSTNIEYGIIECLIERISGESFNEYCKKNIFDPLGMDNTSFRLKDLNISRVAVPYEYQKMPREYQKHQIGGI